LPGGTFSQGRDVNNNGQVAGVSNDASSGAARWAVVWTNVAGVWRIESLGTFTGGCCAYALGLNNGTGGDPATVAVVGNSPISPDQSDAVVWTRGTNGWVPQDLGTLAGDKGSVAYDLNDRGEIVGTSFSPSGIGSGFLWIPASGMLRLSSLGGQTDAFAINDSRDVAGSSTDQFGNVHAVAWRSATNWAIEDLGTLGGCCSQALGINSNGDVVGASDLSSSRGPRLPPQHAFLTRDHASMTDLLSIRGNSASWDLNDFGFAVGGSGTGRAHHAVLWRLP